MKKLLIISALAMAWPAAAQTTSTVVDGVTYEVFPDGSDFPAYQGKAWVLGCSDDVTKAVLLDSVTIGDKKYEVGVIKYEAFYNRTNLESVDIPSTVSYVMPMAFGHTGLKTVTIPASVARIDYGMFYECNKLEKVVLPENFKEIPELMCDGCVALAEINIPDGVTTIGSSAFYGCNKLTDFHFPADLKTIGAGAFARCTSLTSVILPEGTTTLGSPCFSGCTSLEEIYIPASMHNIGTTTFSNVPLKKVTIGSPDKWGQASLDSHHGDANPITVAGSFFVPGKDEQPQHLVVTQGAAAFTFECANNLATARVIGDVGQKAFASCTNLEKVCIDATEIGEDAFYNCPKLTEVYMLTATPPSTPTEPGPVCTYSYFYDNQVFGNNTDFTLYVPVGARQAYLDDHTFGQCANIVETDFAGIDELFKADYEDVAANIDILTPVVPGGSLQVVVDGGALSLPDCEGQPVSVFNPAGQCLYSGTGLNGLALPAGMYIVRAAGAAAKVVIR